MQVVRKYFQDIKGDFDIMACPIRFEPKNIRDERSKSLALRLGGGSLVIAGGVTLTIAAFSFLSLSPITALGWATMGVAAIVFGHDLIKIGNNLREKASQMFKLHVIRSEKPPVISAHLLDRAANTEEEFEAQLRYAQYLSRVSSSKKVPEIDIVKGTWVAKVIQNEFQNLKRIITAYNQAMAFRYNQAMAIGAAEI